MFHQLKILKFLFKFELKIVNQLNRNLPTFVVGLIFKSFFSTSISCFKSLIRAVVDFEAAVLDFISAVLDIESVVF